jgi:hypothetical protein
MRNKAFECVLVLITMLLAGCGGGGGGSSGISYSGLTSQATLTTDNTAEIVIMAFSGTDNSNTLPPLTASGDSSSEVKGALPSIYIANAALKSTEMVFGSGERSASTVYREPIDEIGSCGGTMTGSGTFDDVTGEITANVTFRNYCDNESDIEIVYDGGMELRGNYYDVTVPVDLALRRLRIRFGTEDYTTDGTIRIVQVNPSSVTLTMDIISVDNTLYPSMTFWYRNYELLIVDDDMVTISGRFYHPDFGYVVLDTPSPFSLGGTPTVDGQLNVQGEESKAIMIIYWLHPDRYTILLYADDDETLDYSGSGLLASGYAGFEWDE